LYILQLMHIITGCISVWGRGSAALQQSVNLCMCVHSMHVHMHSIHMCVHSTYVYVQNTYMYVHIMSVYAHSLYTYVHNIYVCMQHAYRMFAACECHMLAVFDGAVQAVTFLSS
jgi:hypothetical protein